MSHFKEILYISNIDMSKTNGAVKHIEAFIMQMSAKGYVVKQFHYGLNKKNSISNLLFYIKSIKFIFRYSKDIDYIYIRNFPLCFLQIIMGRLFHKPIFIEYNSVIEKEIIEIITQAEKLRNIIKLFSKCSVKLSSGIIVLSEGIGKYISEKYRIKIDKIHISSNGGNITNSHPIKKINHKGVIAINDIGWYNVDDIIEIRRLLIKHGISLDIYLATDKEKRYENDVIYNSSINYQNYDWGLIIINDKKGRDKFKYGIRPIKYFEYLSYGLPVIIPDIMDINSITEENDIGIIFKNNKNESIVKTILKIYENRGASLKMSKNALKLIEDKYNWNKLINEIDCFIESRINGK